MSAAHELAERGIAVEVYEGQTIPGGKARSMPVPGSGTGGRSDLPGEHGFRFFPGFYKHLPDTMKRIPFGDQPDGVFGNIVQGTEFQVARLGRTDPILPARFPHSFQEVKRDFLEIMNGDLGIPAKEALFFFDRLLQYATTCEKRRVAEYEHIVWWDYIKASQMSETYQAYLARGLTRSLVAARAEVASTRTIGAVLLQLWFNMTTPGQTLDRVLNGPTNDVWIEPWLTHLRSLGVVYHQGCKVVAIDCVDGRIAKVTIEKADGTRFDAAGDYFISALPVDRLLPLVTPAMVAADARLSRLGNLKTEWMNGIQLYLRRDVPLVNGHTIYTDSPWALTSISQRQFWRDPLTRYGDGSLGGILSIDISDWNQPGVVYGKPAKELTSKEEIRAEVLAQVRTALPEADLGDDNIITYFLDPDITLPNGGATAANLEPLLINTAGSLADRPDVVTQIPNLLLVGDYVRTNTDIATMEAANESARRATNAILANIGSSASFCEIWGLDEPDIFVPMKALDEIRFELGLPYGTLSLP